MTTNRRPNRLAKEKSPYLLQHAYNPVDWFPWGEEAFAKAKAEDKPIFLSIGYSTCHWCHVMERESFEDEEVAALLNKEFVAVKVDREERPDIDHLYMAVCQAMTGQGGWPLTVALTPDKQPFFAGTYFPKQRQYGRFGMMELLPQISGKWKSAREKVLEAGRSIVEETEKRMLSRLEGEVGEETLHEAYESFAQNFDSQYGGFGTAPKFPTPHNLMYLLRYYARTGKQEALHMVETTLAGMQRGGIYDHIGFGFARYATDERWLVPHFEKMLYDNAMLAMTFAEAYQVTGKSGYRDTAEQVLTYALRDMTDPAGGFYSAEDADSEGEEGKFYVWEPDEVRGVLGEDDGELICELFDITEEGNFDGKSIPNLLYDTLAQFASRKGMEPDKLAGIVEQARQKLFACRDQRVHPHKDDKILTSWNGLMIAALAKAAKAFAEPTYSAAAERAAAFIEQKLVREDGRLLARYRDGEAAYPGYIDDYAFYLWGLLELYEATFEAKYFKRALELGNEMIRLFWDEKNGGFFFYGSDVERLFARMKETYDGAIPAGNSVAALCLSRLARMTGDPKYQTHADKTLQAFAGAADQYPIGHAFYLMALAYAYGPSQEIVIAGEVRDAAVLQMAHAARSRFRPNAVLLHMPPGEAGNLMRELCPAAADKTMVENQPAVYLCENFACQRPAISADALK